MSDKFDQRLREKLGGYETPFEPTDWAALNERLDARDTGSNRRIALILFGAILLGSAVLGALYQLDMRQIALSGEIAPDSSVTNQGFSAVPDMESPSTAKRQAQSERNTGESAMPDFTADQDITGEASVAAGTVVDAMPSRSDGPVGVGAIAKRSGSNEIAGTDVDAAQALMSPQSSTGTSRLLEAENRSTANISSTAQKAVNSPTAVAAGKTTTAVSGAEQSELTERSLDESSDRASLAASPPVSAETSANERGAGSASLAADAQSGNSPSTRQTEERPKTGQGNQLSLARSMDHGVLAPGKTGSLPDARFAGLITSPLYPITPIAASNDPFALPQDRSWAPEKRDITLRKTPVRWAFAAGPGLTTALTSFGDGFRPAWDIGVAGEAWFGSGAFVSAGLRYGVYRFHQSDVACGDHAAHGLSDAVHCPDAMLGDESLWEIPLQAGYGMDLKKINGRFRVFGGLSARISRQADYHVEFHNVSAGDTLFFDPVVINVAPTATTGYPENYTYDANALQDMTSITTAAPPTGNEQGAKTSRTSLAVELGFGYEQFLAPTVSLGIQPRVDIPLNRLPMGEGRSYHLGMNAMLRWYPNWNR